MSFLSAMWVIFCKDLRIELRSREIVLSTALFAFLSVVLAAFAFDVNALSGRETSTGVLWIAIAFSGLLALSRTFLRERDFGVWDSLLLTPIPRAAVYAGKMLGVLVFLFAVELALLPAIEILFQTPFIAHLGPVALILLLGTFGYAAVGVFFAAMTIRTRLRDLLLGVILYPLVAPILICAVKATSAAVWGDGISSALFYVKLLIVIDIIYFVGGLWLFEFMMED